MATPNREKPKEEGEQPKTPFETLLFHSNNFLPNDFSFEDTVMMFFDGS